MNFNQQNEFSEKAAEAVEIDMAAAQAMWGFLEKAAKIAAKAGLPPDGFAAAAWQAYLAASPELAERLAEKQFQAALEELRNSGRMAKA